MSLEYPPRWVAIKLLENDAKIKELVSPKSQTVIQASEILAKKIEEVHQAAQLCRGGFGEVFTGQSDCP